MSTLHLNSTLINEFYLPDTARQTLKSHFLRFWTGEYLKHTITAAGTILCGEIEYIVILPVCNRSKFFEASQVKLSFRESKPEYNIMPYVLVRFA